VLCIQAAQSSLTFVMGLDMINLVTTWFGQNRPPSGSAAYQKNVNKNCGILNCLNIHAFSFYNGDMILEGYRVT
jgi:hypothetical protein